MRTITNASTVVRKQDIVAANMDGETVMMSVMTGKYYNLGQIGGVIWDILEAPILVSDLVEKLMDRYEVSHEKCESDVISLLQSMLKQKLIEII